MDEALVELGSEEWVARAEGVIRSLVAGVDLEGQQVSWYEEFTSPPAHLLRPGEETLTWFAVIGDDGVRTGRGTVEDPTFWVAADYEVALAFCHLRYDDPRLAELAATLRPDQMPVVHGDRGEIKGGLAQALGGLHDAMVALTS
ncbi:MAG TPA: hypothetical protein VM938_15625 [Acidimicrobiales bacterium]|nr:hypothetical protein [Acidimicrobiales bacterium]